MPALRGEGPALVSPSAVLHGEFDPGSGRTLAAWLTHANGAPNRAARGQRRQRSGNTWVTYPDDRDNPRKLGLIPDVVFGRKEASASASGWARGALACWWGNGLPRRRCVAGLRGRSATLGLRHGPDSYGRQQWGILRNARKRDAATPRGGRRPSGCKPLSGGRKVHRLIAVWIDGTSRRSSG